MREVYFPKCPVEEEIPIKGGFVHWDISETISRSRGLIPKTEGSERIGCSCNATFALENPQTRRDYTYLKLHSDDRERGCRARVEGRYTQQHLERLRKLGASDYQDQLVPY